MSEGRIVVISGPIGAGKSTVAQALVARASVPTIWIEGDDFWNFSARGVNLFSRLKNFELMIRSMFAAALPWAKGGYQVVLDFSIPPDSVPTLQSMAIGRNIPVDFVLLRPSLEECARRAANREEGVVTDYTEYEYFYEQFSPKGLACLQADDASPDQVAEKVEDLVRSGSTSIC